jgi:hypothetical protein
MIKQYIVEPNNCMANTHCLNCGKTVHGNYCAHCGQKTTVAKLTWKTVVEEFVHFFTHAEHSFVYTTKKMITKPGLVMRDFLEGKRQLIHKPITFVLVWGAIDKLLQSFYSYCADHFQLYRFEDTAPSFRILWQGPKNPGIVANETWITLLLQVPLLVLIGWLVFRKTKTTVVERWVIITYGIAATMILSAVMRIATFLLRLAEVPISRGAINDGYFVCYQLLITWVIYSFQKVYRPQLSTPMRILTAFITALIANYASDIAFYLLYRFSA